jgi:hypothetical protein
MVLDRMVLDRMVLDRMVLDQLHGRQPPRPPTSTRRCWQPENRVTTSPHSAASPKIRALLPNRPRVPYGRSVGV